MSYEELTQSEKCQEVVKDFQTKPAHYNWTEFGVARFIPFTPAEGEEYAYTMLEEFMNYLRIDLEDEIALGYAEEFWLGSEENKVVVMVRRV